MNLPTQAQVYTALRYAGVTAGTVGSIAALAGVVDQQTAQNIVAAFQAVVKDLTQLFGDASKLALLVIPVVTVWLAKIGYSSASPASQKASVAATGALVVETKSSADAVAVANAIATVTQVQKVTATPEIAAATPSDKIVAE